MTTDPPNDVVFGFFTDTWNDAVDRGLMRPPDQFVLGLLEDKRVDRVLVADPRRFLGAQLRRHLRRSGLAPLPTGGHATAALHRPVRIAPGRPISGRRLRRDLARQSAQLRRAARRLHMTAPVVVTCDPLFAGLAPLGWASSVTYYARDDFASFEPLRPMHAAIVTAYSQIVARRRQVVAVSQGLLDAIGTDRGVVVPNGIVVQEWDDPAPPPDWFAALQAPRLLYTGSLDQRLSPTQLAAAAAAVPGGSVCLVGPHVDPAHVRRLATIDGVHVHDSVGRDELVRVVHAADACLIPHEDNALTRSMSPIKLYEYLAAGRPVVSTDLPPVRGVHESVVLVQPGNDFGDGVRAALAHGPLAEVTRSAFVVENSWQARYEEILSAAAPGIAAGLGHLMILDGP
ncbi:MAG: glycosyltransferase [Propionibacteriaceae bacterium]